MASRYEVEVKLMSARDLKNVNWRHGPLKPYAVVWVDSARKLSTRVDDEGDTCPNWNQTLVVTVDRPIEDATLYIDVVHAYAAEDTKPLIGSAKLPLREVVDDVGIGSRAITRELKLKRPSGRPHGKIEVEVRVKDTRYNAPDPYYAAPYGVRDAPPQPFAPPNPYGAPPSAYGVAPIPAYGAPIPAYGAPPSGYPSYGQAPGYQQSGYGQPSYGQAGYGQVVEEKKKSKFGGMGMGTGLAVGALGGVLGGLAISEGIDALEDHVADEAAEKVEEDLAAGNDDDYYDDGGDDGW